MGVQVSLLIAYVVLLVDTQCEVITINTVCKHSAVGCKVLLVHTQCEVFEVIAMNMVCRHPIVGCKVLLVLTQERCSWVGW